MVFGLGMRLCVRLRTKLGPIRIGTMEQWERQIAGSQIRQEVGGGLVV